MIADILGRFRFPVFSAWRFRSSLSSPDHNDGRRTDLQRSGLLVIVSIACGRIGLSGEVLLLPVAMFFPLLWAMASSRWIAALVAAGYFLAASRGLPQGVANFYSADLWPGLALWLVASASSVTVHAMLWTKPRGENASGRKGTDAARAFRYLLAMALTGLPPFGIAGWAHPLTAAGVVFPGWGWWGLFAMATGLTVMTTRFWPAAAITLSAFWLWSAASWTEPKLPDAWRGVHLEVGQNLGRDGSLLYHRDLIAKMLRRTDTHPDTRIVVLPESTLGFWTPTIARVWRDGLRGSGLTVIAGAAAVDPKGYDNVMVVISADAANILYRERMPVPGSMWQPWLQWTAQGGGARADFFGNPVVDVDGFKVAPLICYEQLIVWPILQSMLHGPEMIVAVGNGWWTKNTSIVAIQKASVTAWARLFGLPAVLAFKI